MEHKLGETLDQLMQECNIDDASLARETGIPASTISRLKTNPDANPTISSLEPLAKYFAVSVDQLLGWKSLSSDRIPGTFNADGFTSSRMPILQINWVEDWCKNNTDSFKAKLTRWVSTEKEVGEHAFALVISKEEVCLMFSSGSTLIIDPDRAPANRDIILISVGKNSSKPTLKILISDGDEMYLKSVNPEIMGIKPLDDEYKIWGTIVEIKYSPLSETEATSRMGSYKPIYEPIGTAVMIK